MKTHHFLFDCDEPAWEVYVSDAQDVLHICAEQLALPPTEISVSLVDEAEMQALNHQYRQLDRVTDVLSFEQGETVDGVLILGDIVICPPVAVRQATEKKWPPVQEMRLLLIHGLLHLMGHDHAEPEEEQEMFRIQDQLLADVETQLPYPAS